MPQIICEGHLYQNKLVVYTAAILDPSMEAAILDSLMRAALLDVKKNLVLCHTQVKTKPFGD